MVKLLQKLKRWNERRIIARQVRETKRGLEWAIEEHAKGRTIEQIEQFCKEADAFDTFTHFDVGVMKYVHAVRRAQRQNYHVPGVRA